MKSRACGVSLRLKGCGVCLLSAAVFFPSEAGLAHRKAPKIMHESGRLSADLQIGAVERVPARGLRQTCDWLYRRRPADNRKLTEAGGHVRRQKK